jgi:Fe-S cluster assembly protein SufB
MSYTEKELKEELDNKSYEFGFVTDIESEKAPIGLNEDTVKLISSKKNEPKWLLAYRLEAFRVWQKNVRTKLGSCKIFKARFSKHFLLFSSKKEKRTPKFR